MKSDAELHPFEVALLESESADWRPTRICVDVHWSEAELFKNKARREKVPATEAFRRLIHEYAMFVWNDMRNDWKKEKNNA